LIIRLTSIASVTYTYDGDGGRVKKSNGTLYWPGLGGDVLAETDLQGNLVREYVYFGGERIARRVPEFEGPAHMPQDGMYAPPAKSRHRIFYFCST
jgi:hypothetical protein